MFLEFLFTYKFLYIRLKIIILIVSSPIFTPALPLEEYLRGNSRVRLTNYELDSLVTLTKRRSRNKIHLSINYGNLVVVESIVEYKVFGTLTRFEYVT